MPASAIARQHANAMALERSQGFGDFVTVDPAVFDVLGPPPEWPSTPDGDSGSDGPPWWMTSAPLFGVIGKTLSNIFSPVGTSVAQAQGAPVQYQYAPQNYREPPSSSGVGIGIDSQGIRLSDGSHVGWAPIVGVIGLFVVLQMKPLTRR